MAYAIITATSITDASGQLLAEGFLYITPSGEFTSSSSNVIPKAVTRQIANGALVGNLSLLRSDSSIPLGISYQASVTDALSRESFDLGNFEIFSPTFDLSQIPSSFIPTVAPAPVSGNTTVSVGTTVTLAPGLPATVTSSNGTLNFGIPQGLPGTNGANGANGTNGSNGTSSTVAAGVATSLPAGSLPTLTNTGTSSAAIFDIGVPQGASGLNGTNGLPGTNGTNALSPIFTIAASTLAAGSSATASVTGTYPNLSVALGIPQGAQGVAGTGGSGTSTSGVSSVGSIGSLFAASTSSSGAVTFAPTSQPVLQGLGLLQISNPLGYGYQFLVGPTPTANRAFVVDCFGGLFGMYNSDTATYYGFGATPIPPANWVVLTSYFNGMAIKAKSKSSNSPIFSVANSGQALSGQGINSLALFIDDSNRVLTYNNTLDDNAGNMAVAKALTIGSAIPTASAVTISAGAGVPTGNAANGSIYMNTSGAASTTFYVMVAGTWTAKA